LIQPKGRRPAPQRSQSVLGGGPSNTNKVGTGKGTRQVQFNEDEEKTEDEDREDERNEAENSEDDERVA
jgi:hypothetical protein